MVHLLLFYPISPDLAIGVVRLVERQFLQTNQVVLHPKPLNSFVLQWIVAKYQAIEPG